MPRVSQLLEEVFGARVVVHLHPAFAELVGGVGVGSRRLRLAEILRELRRGAIRRRIAPRVVGLDDVDPRSELNQACRPKVRAMAVERVGDVGEPAHAVNEVHRLLGDEKRRHAAGDEEADHLAFERLRLFTGDRQLWREAHQVQRSFDAVVVR